MVTNHPQLIHFDKLNKTKEFLVSDENYSFSAMFEVVYELSAVCGRNNKAMAVKSFPNVEHLINGSLSIQNMCARIDIDDLNNDIKALKELDDEDDDEKKKEEERKHIMRMFFMRKIFKPLMDLNNFPSGMHELRLIYTTGHSNAMDQRFTLCSKSTRQMYQSCSNLSVSTGLMY